MRKIIVTVLGSLLLLPAGSLAQDVSANDDRMGQRNTLASTGTLREAAIQHARSAAAAPNARVQATRGRTWAERHPVLLGTLLGAAAGAGVALFGAGAVNGCENDECRVGYARGGAIAGAGAGALIGFGVWVARP
jgi:hypothetical protein